jgi:L-fucose isomerase-like protein
MKTRIMKIYFDWDKPITGWTWDVEKNMKEAEEHLKNIQDRLGNNIEFVNGGIVKNVGDVKRLQEKIKGVDGILTLKVTTCFPRDAFTEILNFDIPTIFFCSFYSGSGWPELLGIARDSKRRVDYIFSSDYNEIIRRLRLIDAVRRVKQTKLLVVSESLNEEYVEKAKERFGLEFKRIDFQQLQKVFDSIDFREAEEDTSQWIEKAEKVVEKEVNKEEIIRSSRLYLAIKKLFGEENANGIAIDCLGGFANKLLPAYPCLAFSKLDDEGLTGTCQADLNSALTKVVIGNIAGKPGFVSDPEIDVSTNLLAHYHCTAPTKMDGPSGLSQPYIIRSHGGDYKGAALQVKMKLGQKITMAKLVGLDKMLISTGEIVGNAERPDLCRTHFTVKVENARKMLDTWSYGDHRVIFYGDYVEDVGIIGKFLKFELFREG